ncbi:hypothetical protein [Micromonospora sp. RP3T]|uniref:hypothetical protein n=1 Tax=Micromonospora sp. RP3T TaxID=2135446 RepID=UPI000D1582FC|nr:hypothetical protein [Micromonospora sp. RP3T]PTA44438.1 hypothetical protein C8054_20285 [Micromonospora sp. RP3T]
MRVRDRLTAVVVTLAFVLAALGSAAGPPAAALPAAAPPAVGPSAVGVHTLDPSAVDRNSVGPAAVVPASGCRAGPVASHGAYPQQRCAELSGGWWGDRRGGLAYGDGPDEPLPTAPPRVAGPVMSARLAPGHRSPARPLPPRGALAARAPPTA